MVVVVKRNTFPDDINVHPDLVLLPSPSGVTGPVFSQVAQLQLD